MLWAVYVGMLWAVYGWGGFGSVGELREWGTRVQLLKGQAMGEGQAEGTAAGSGRWSGRGGGGGGGGGGVARCNTIKEMGPPRRLDL